MKRLAVVLGLSLLLACNSSTPPSPIPTPVPATPTPTETPTPTPTITPTPTNTPTPTATPAAPFSTAEISRVDNGSTYDNWVVKSGGKYIQFRCQNTPSPVYRDRIWRSESNDGVSNWTNDRIVIEGTSETAQDDLSCSPGVVIDPRGVWHLYYVTAARATVCKIEMWHATSLDGLTWTKLGRVPAVMTSDCSLVEPSPVIEGDRIAVYFPVNWMTPDQRPKLWAMFSNDGYGGQAFSSPLDLGTPSNFFGGRVTKADGIYYLAYSGTLDGTNKIPDAVYLTSSPVLNFKDGYRVAKATPGTFFATQMIAGNYIDGRLYISGNYMPLCPSVTPPTACSDYPNAVGLIHNVPVWTPTPTPTPTVTPTRTAAPCPPGPGGIC